MATIFVADHESKHEITNIHIYDASGPTWSGNLLNAPLPYLLLPAVPAIGDCLYFGSDTSMEVVGGTFYNVVFNIAIAGSGYTAEWEWLAWDGAAWVWGPITLTPAYWYRYDETNFLMIAGNNRVAMWPQALIAAPPGGYYARPANLNTILGGAAPSITGYWFRLRVTGITTPTAPVQAEEHPYYANKPFIEIDNQDEIKGDVPALASVAYKLRHGGDRVVCSGVRSFDKGEDFNSWIHLTDKGNKPGITVTNIAGIGFIDWYLGYGTVYSPSDRLHYYPSPAGVPLAETEIIRVYIDETLSQQYIGAFRCFLIASWSTSGGVPTTYWDLYYKLKISQGSLGNIIYSSAWVAAFEGTYASSAETVDFGKINIPIIDMSKQDGTRLWFRLYIKQRYGFERVCSVALVLIPTDESYCETKYPDMVYAPSYRSETWIKFDSIGYPKHGVCAPIISTSNNLLSDNAFVTAPIGFNFQRGTKQRIWSHFSVSYHHSGWYVLCLNAQAEKAERYLSMRGDR